MGQRYGCATKAMADVPPRYRIDIHREKRMQRAGYLMGQFPLARLCIFHFRVQDFSIDSAYVGLLLLETFLIVHLVSGRDGRHILFVRSLMLYARSGFLLNTSRGTEGLYQDAR